MSPLTEWTWCAEYQDYYRIELDKSGSPVCIWAKELQPRPQNISSTVLPLHHSPHSTNKFDPRSVASAAISYPASYTTAPTIPTVPGENGHGPYYSSSPRPLQPQSNYASYSHFRTPVSNTPVSNTPMSNTPVSNTPSYTPAPTKPTVPGDNGHELYSTGPPQPLQPQSNYASYSHFPTSIQSTSYSAMSSQQTPRYVAQDPQQNTQGLGDELKRNGDKDNNRDMGDNDKVGSRLVSNSGLKR